MVMTTVLVECAICRKETEAKYKDCDACYEKYLDAGGEPEGWGSECCEHLQCLECGEPPF